MSVVLSWSGGKDSALALWTMREEGNEPAALLTTIVEDGDRVGTHAVRAELVRAQAAAAGLPLIEAPIPEAPSNEVYETRIAAALDGWSPAIQDGDPDAPPAGSGAYPGARSPAGSGASPDPRPPAGKAAVPDSPPPADTTAVADSASSADPVAVAFADLFLADIRAYREERLTAAGRARDLPALGPRHRRAGARVHRRRLRRDAGRRRYRAARPGLRRPPLRRGAARRPSRGGRPLWRERRVPHLRRLRADLREADPDHPRRAPGRGPLRLPRPPPGLVTPGSHAASRAGTRCNSAPPAPSGGFPLRAAEVSRIPTICTPPNLRSADGNRSSRRPGRGPDGLRDRRVGGGRRPVGGGPRRRRDRRRGPPADASRARSAAPASAARSTTPPTRRSSAGSPSPTASRISPTPTWWSRRCPRTPS